MAAERTAPVERERDFGRDADGLVRRWIAEIANAEGEPGYAAWRKRAAAIVERYRDERSDGNVRGVRFNILWSNIQTLLPALYARPPKPEVDRRYKDSDPAARVAAQVIERAVAYAIEACDLDAVLRRVTLDHLLTGLGQARIYYRPTFGDEVTPEDGEPYRPKTFEEVSAGYVFYQDFLWQPARQWSDVGWVAFREYLTRRQLVERFGGELGNAIPMDAGPKGKDESKPLSNVFKRAVVWEVWNREDGQVLWIAPAYRHGPLDVKDDPLGLRGFFPCPEPLLANVSTDTLVPVPDYYQYQDLALELDTLSERISILVRSLRLVGVYDGQLGPKLSELLNLRSDNELIPVDQWAMFAERGGLRGVMQFLPVEEVGRVLSGLYQAREAVKQALYEVTGIADVIRGATAASETATAQQIKGRFATLRLSARQGEVTRFARDIVRLMGEVVAEHFSWSTLSLMTGIGIPTEAEVRARMMQAMAPMGAMLPPPVPQGMPAPPAAGPMGGLPA